MFHIFKSKLCLALCLPSLFFAAATPTTMAGDCLNGVWPTVFDSTRPDHESIYPWQNHRGECEYGVDWDPTNSAFMQMPLGEIFENAGIGPFDFKFTIGTAELAQSDSGMVRVFELASVITGISHGGYPAGAPVIAVHLGWNKPARSAQPIYYIRGLYFAPIRMVDRLTNMAYLEPDIVQIPAFTDDTLNIVVRWLPSTDPRSEDGFLHLYVNGVLLAGKYDLSIPLSGYRGPNAVRYGAMQSQDRDGFGTLRFRHLQPSPFEPYFD